MIKLGIIMDPIESIKIKKDTSFAMMLEAQHRGYEIHYMEINDIYLNKGEARALTKIIFVEDNIKKWFNFYSEQDVALSDLNVILMRKDPPFNIEFIYATYILERAEYAGSLVVNKPSSLRDCNEKLFTLWFSELIPNTLVTRDPNRLKDFYKKNGDIILKVLDKMGGMSIFRLKENDCNVDVIIETITKYGSRFCMAQKFLHSIKEGDKRVFIVDGKPIPYCLARIPANGETRCNLAAGGYGEVRLLNKSDIMIANIVAPKLKEKGLFFAGLDIIGDKLTEINITSPTCVREIESEYNVFIIKKIMNSIEYYLKNI
ncbi:glutathione synthase [Candidatus Providencia siddallii]|uniref:Glutathione synthetase n=1 Tax=Candidatus Providencia siddallii TaxID=1715285 RepID=A0ABM9NNL8_9GAMM